MHSELKTVSPFEIIAEASPKKTELFMPIRKQSIPNLNFDGASESVKNRPDQLDHEQENDSLKEQVAQYLISSSPKQS